MSSCEHNDFTFDRYEENGNSYVVHLTCRSCGSSGSFAIEHEWILWPEEDEEEPTDCDSCDGTGIVGGQGYLGSDNMDVVMVVMPCDDCTAHEAVPAEIFGTYDYELPARVERYLKAVGVFD